MPAFHAIKDKSFRRLTMPESEPVTPAEAKLHCSVPTAVTEFDTQFAAWITAAREALEVETERTLIQTEYELALDQFPADDDRSGNWNKLAIELPRVPAIEITSFGYYDLNGDWTEVPPDEYIVDLAGQPPRLTPLAGVSWPIALNRPRAVVVTWTAGYTDPDEIPEMARQAIRLDIAHWWRTRESAGERPARAHDRAWQTLANSLKWR